MKVLLIDDDPAIAEDLRLLLPRQMDLEWAPGSADALSLLKTRKRPDVIVLDLCMPPHLAKTREEEGLATLTLLRTKLAIDVPVIVLSALPKIQAEAQCLNSGASDYLEKPCVIRELVTKLERAVGSQGA